MTPMHVIVLGVLVVSLACGLEVRDLNGTHIMHVDRLVVKTPGGSTC